jgi:hypothetical protein
MLQYSDVTLYPIFINAPLSHKKKRKGHIIYQRKSTRRMNYYRIGSDDVEVSNPRPPQTIHIADWTSIQNHITDNVPLNVIPIGVPGYKDIKETQLKTENRKTDVLYVRYEDTVLNVLISSIMLCNDFKIESLTGDIPVVMVVTTTPICKIIHALVAVFAQNTVADLQTILNFMELVKRQAP